MRTQERDPYLQRYIMYHTTQVFDFRQFQIDHLLHLMDPIGHFSTFGDPADHNFMPAPPRASEPDSGEPGRVISGKSMDQMFEPTIQTGSVNFLKGYMCVWVKVIWYIVVPFGKLT